MLSRRDFLLSSVAAGAFAMGGCATVVPRSETAKARALYDEIFQGMLRVAPENATALGLDTGELAYLKRRLSDSGPREGKISNESPVGRALMGKKLNDEVQVNVTKGVITMKITKIG